MTLYGPQRVIESHFTLAEPRDSERQIALSGLENGMCEVLGWHRMWRHPDYEVRTSAFGGKADSLTHVSERLLIANTGLSWAFK